MKFINQVLISSLGCVLPVMSMDSKPFYKDPEFYIVWGLIGAAASIPVVQWWQRRQINKVLKKYNKEYGSLSDVHKAFMSFAYQRMAFPFIGIKGLSFLQEMENEWVIPAMTELFFGSEPTVERMQRLQKLIGITTPLPHTVKSSLAPQ